MPVSSQEIKAAPVEEELAPPAKVKTVFGGLFSRAHAEPPAAPAALPPGALQLVLIAPSPTTTASALCYLSCATASAYSSILCSLHMQCLVRGGNPLLSHYGCAAAEFSRSEFSSLSKNVTCLWAILCMP